MEPHEKQQLLKDVAFLNLGEKEKLKISNERLKLELEEVIQKFNDYKVLMQSKVLPRYDNFHRILRESEWDRDKTKAINDALWNFISENGLGEKCYDQIFEDLPTNEFIDYRGKNDTVYSDFDKGQAMAGLIYHVKNYGHN